MKCQELWRIESSEANLFGLYDQRNVVKIILEGYLII